jgi:hypothetical protein
MFSSHVIVSLCYIGILCLALIVGTTSIGLIQGGGEACLHIETLLAQTQRLSEVEDKLSPLVQGWEADHRGQ